MELVLKNTHAVRNYSETSPEPCGFLMKLGIIEEKRVNIFKISKYVDNTDVINKNKR